MNISRILVIGGLTALSFVASACTSTNHKDITIETDSNTKIQFDGYKTFAWAAAAAVVRDPDSQWTAPDIDVSAEITYLVNRELRERDLVEVTSDPDMYVLYGVGIDMKNLDMVTDDKDGSAHLEEVPEGAVVIMVTDPQTEQVLWIGSAKSGLDETRTREETRERLDWAVSQMFEKSPF